MNQDQNMQQPLNDDGSSKKGRQNKLERKRNKHSGAINSFSLSTHSQIQSGYVSGSERKPTNCVFLFVFLAFIAAMFVISIMGFAKGNYHELIAGLDSNGRICGNAQDPAVAEFPNIYYMLDTDIASGAICVKECPKNKEATIECAPTVNHPTCDIQVAYATRDILNYCLPSNPAAIGQAFSTQFDELKETQALSTFWRDMQIASVAIYVSLGLALVYTIMYLYLMSHCAHMLAYVAIGLLELLFIAGMGACIYGATRPGVNSNGMWIGFGSTLVAFLLFNCMMWCYWSKLQVAIAVIDSTADFMVATKRISLVTIYYFFMSIIVFVVWGIGLVGVIAMNKVQVVQGMDGRWSKKITIQNDKIFMLVIMAFGIVWIMNFIREKTKFIYMISAAQFYFTSNREKTGSASVVAGMAISNFKHAGSIALGSLLHTFIFFLRIIVESIISASEKKNGQNAIMCLVACLLRCCVGCLENLIEYLNTTAYAFMAISGDPYCKSAWNGFLLNLKHLIKFYFADTLAGMFVFIGMLVIVGLNGGTCYLIMRYGTKNSDELSSVWVPMIVIMIATFIIAELFLGFFHQAVKATLMCLAVDIELNGEVKFGSPSFHEKMDAAYGKLEGAQQADIHVHTNYNTNTNTYNQQTFQQPPYPASNQVNNTNNSMV